MRRLIYTSIAVDESDLAECLREMSPFRLKSQNGPINQRYSLWFVVTREDLPRAEEITRRYCEYYKRYPDRPLSYREECVFTKAELDGAEMLAVRVNRSPLNFVSASEGMAYDYSVAPSVDNPAPWCWQKTPRLMRRSEMPKPEVGLHQTIPNEILVHARLRESVRGLSHPHVRLGPVVASGAPTDWFQLMTSRVMPPYHEATTGVVGPSPQTNADDRPSSWRENPPLTSPPNVYDDPSEGYWPAYARQSVLDRFGNVPPIAFTYELLGTWVPDKPGYSQPAPPQPRLLVDQQTRRELLAAGVKRLEYVPVRWVEG